MGFGFWETLIVSILCIIGLTGLGGFAFMVYASITDKGSDKQEPK